MEGAAWGTGASVFPPARIDQRSLTQLIQTVDNTGVLHPIGRDLGANARGVTYITFTTAVPSEGQTSHNLNGFVPKTGLQSKNGTWPKRAF